MTLTPDGVLQWFCAGLVAGVIVHFRGWLLARFGSPSRGGE